MSKLLKICGILIAILIVILVGYSFLNNKYAKKSDDALAAVPTPIPHTDFREISKLDPARNQVMITIDAGSGERSADGLLKALAKHHLKSTFFIVGKLAEQHVDIVKRIAKEGHEIFNHSYNHDDYTTLTKEEIKADLAKNDAVLFNMTGKHTLPYFRAPFGYRNELVKEAGAEAGYQHIYWSVDAIDWREGETGESIKKRVLDHVHPGAIVLLHIDDVPTGDVADELFTELENRGYKLVSLTEALK